MIARATGIVSLITLALFVAFAHGDAAAEPLSLRTSSTTIAGGKPITITVAIGTKAPKGGVSVRLTDNQSPLLAVPSRVEIEEGRTSASVRVEVASVTSNRKFTVTAKTGRHAASITVLVVPAVLKSVSLPDAIVTGKSGSLSVSFTGPVARDTTVTLTPSNSKLALPGSVIVPKGASSVRVTYQPAVVTKNTRVTLTVASGAGKLTDTTVITPPALSSASGSPSTIEGLYDGVIKLRLNAPAPASGLTVTLASSDARYVSLPASVDVPAGATAIEVPFSTGSTTVDRQITVTASGGGVTKTAKITVLTRQPHVTRIEILPEILVYKFPAGAAGAVYLDKPAGPKGAKFTLVSSDRSRVSVGSSVTVPAGEMVGYFTVRVAKGDLATVTISVVDGPFSISAEASVQDNAMYFVEGPARLEWGLERAGRVMTYMPAPPRTTQVMYLESSDPGVLAVPDSIAIPYDSQSVSIPLAPALVTESVNVTVTVFYGWQTLSFNTTVNPPSFAISAVELPADVIGGDSAQGTVRLDRPAPPGGMTVNLSTSPTSLGTTVESLFIVEGESNATFTVVTTGTATQKGLQVTAAISGSSRRVTMQVLPVPTPTPTPTSTSTPEPTATPEPTGAPEEPTATSTEEPTETPLPTSTPTETPDQDP